MSHARQKDTQECLETVLVAGSSFRDLESPVSPFPAVFAVWL